MLKKGIRLRDRKENIGISIELFDILSLLKEPHRFFWSIQWIDIIPMTGKGKKLLAISKEINNSENGTEYDWQNLKNMSTEIIQTIDLVLLGDQDRTKLHKYATDREMFESCDIVIQMIDSSFWEIFSKDESLLEILSKKFKKTELITSDYIP